MNLKKIKKMFGESQHPKGQCCFCGEVIDNKSLVVMNLDLGDQQFQSLYSHGLCLKEKLHSSVPFLAPEEVEGE
ncbi:hypothetical protein [Microbulbifer sp. TRSA007]|uniref:hypothetical protein n=1 Tax=unclassified Microbulbifer TaxID=2619833 RepID=UPI004038FD7D